MLAYLQAVAHRAVPQQLLLPLLLGFQASQVLARQCQKHARPNSLHRPPASPRHIQVPEGAGCIPAPAAAGAACATRQPRARLRWWLRPRCPPRPPKRWLGTPGAPTSCPRPAHRLGVKSGRKCGCLWPGVLQVSACWSLPASCAAQHDCTQMCARSRPSRQLAGRTHVELGSRPAEVKLRGSALQLVGRGVWRQVADVEHVPPRGQHVLAKERCKGDVGAHHVQPPLERLHASLTMAAARAGAQVQFACLSCKSLLSIGALR